jgi:hypothetical protein
MERGEDSAGNRDLLARAEQPAPGFFKEFLLYLRESRKWWLIPLVIILLLASALVLLSGSAVGPFIYPLF